MATPDDLLDVLDRLRGLLRQHGEDFFADWIDGDFEKVARGDGECARHFLQAFGGMGSFNDVVLEPRAANEELGALREEGFQLATQLTREELK